VFSLAAPIHRGRAASALAASALAAIALAVFAATAWGGAPITRLPDCANDHVVLGSGEAAEVQFRTSMLCLINGARADEHLPALKRSGELETVATNQSEKFARTGVGSHGPSLSDIGKRDAAAGYHTAAYNEAFDFTSGGTPFAFLVSSVGTRSVPCTEVFDPRFRDVGIDSTEVVRDGQTIGYTLAIEFGLRAGQRQPSTNTSAQSSCPHSVKR
jgi:uncharacterized protein YkwD